MASVDSASSLSVHWRQEGNTHYKSSQRPSLPLCLQKSYLSDALLNYNNAYKTGKNPDETSSAAKNIATASWKMAGVHEGLKSKFAVQHYFYKEALSYFDRALQHSRDVKPQTWIDPLKDNYQQCVQNAVDILLDLPFEDKIMSLEQYIHVMSDMPPKADVYVEMGQQIFRSGITCLSNGDYKKALCCMRDCYRPTQEAKRLADGREYILDEVRILENDCFLHQCAAESMQSREIGDGLFEQCLNEEEDLNMTLVYEVLDWYKKAILLTRENEVEMEAIALSRLGRVYDKVLKIKYKAKDNFMRSIQLAHSLHPRTFNSQDWYQTAAEAVERYQQETLQQEHDVWQKEREQYLKELEKELASLKSKAYDNEHGDLSDEGLLRFVYKTFPPKNKKHRLPKKIDVSELKKVFQKAVVHYHPDKMKEHGKKWVVMCEEITKILTQKYERHK